MGIIQGLNLIITWQNEYNFSIPEIDGLIQDKLEVVMSMDAKGFDALIESIKSLALTIENRQPEQPIQRGSIR
jgi:hypothetical protein